MICKGFQAITAFAVAAAFSFSAQADGVVKHTIDLGLSPLLREANMMLSLGEPEKAVEMYQKALMSGLSEHS